MHSSVMFTTDFQAFISCCLCIYCFPVLWETPGSKKKNLFRPEVTIYDKTQLDFISEPGNFCAEEVEGGLDESKKTLHESFLNL